jgi:hypothetical protein
MQEEWSVIQDEDDLPVKVDADGAFGDIIVHTNETLKAIRKLNYDGLAVQTWHTRYTNKRLFADAQRTDFQQEYVPYLEDILQEVYDEAIDFQLLDGVMDALQCSSQESVDVCVFLKQRQDDEKEGGE